MSSLLWFKMDEQVYTCMHVYLGACGDPFSVNPLFYGLDIVPPVSAHLA